MEKSSKVQFKGQSSLKPPIDKVGESKYNQFVDTVSIRSLVDANVTLTGTNTGNVYNFAHAGHIVEVDVRDKDEILDKKRGRACCGGSSGKQLFELA